MDQFSLPQFFTMRDLIKLCGCPPEWSQDPRLTMQINQMLRAAGFTQRIIHSGGSVERTWSRNWGGASNKEQRYRPKPVDQRKLDLLALLKTIL